MKRFIAFFTALCLILGAVTLPTWAEEVIRISTAEELMALAGGDMDGNYLQTADIDLKGKSFTPIGTLEAPFTGVYNGNGYTISGMDVGGEGKEYQGLFGVNCGTVKNVVLASDCAVAGSGNVGGIAGRNCGVIEDCISDAKVYHIPKQEEDVPSFTLFCQNLCQWGDDALAANSSYVDGVTNSRRPGMIARIRKQDPDLMCFQEVSFAARTKSGKTISGWDTFLKNQLTDYTFEGDYRSNTDKEGVMVAYKTEKFTCLDSGMFWLSPNPDAPRAQQTPAWGASHVRTAAWLLLEDKESGTHLAVYSVHLDHTSALARANGGLVVAEKMEAIKQQYPDAIFMVAGDYNEGPDNPGYAASDGIFNGMMDDARYSAAVALPDIEHGTCGDINSHTATSGTIDYIFMDSSMVEINSFEVLTDYYNNLRPSDHHGLIAEFEAVQNNNIGGLVGINNGTVQRVIARGSAQGVYAEAVGNAIGNNTGKTEAVYLSDTASAVGTGKTVGISALPQEPDIRVVATLNRLAERGAFTLLEGDYFLIGSRSIKAPVCLTVNGVDTAAYAGDIYTAADLGITDPSFILNGIMLDGNTFTVPPEGGVLTVAPHVTEVREDESIGHYTVKSMEEFLYLYRFKEKFEGKVIHLLCDLDFSEKNDFTSLADPGFSFDGHEHTVRNWGTEQSPIDEIGFFNVSVGSMGMEFIRNLTFENCYIRETSNQMGMALVYGVNCPNAGMAGLPTEFHMENVHVKDCFLGAADIEATGFLLSRYGVPNEFVDVYLKNCSVVGSTLDAESHDHKGLMVGKVRSNAALKQARFFFEDCFIAENTMLNTTVFSGLVMGSIESTSIDAYLDNVGVFNNTLNGEGDGALITCMDQGGIVVERTVLGGNILNKANKYLISSHNRNPVNITFNEVYSDTEDFNGVAEGKSVSHTADQAAVESGAAGHRLNQLATEPAFYWSKDGTSYCRGTATQQIRRLTVRDGQTETVTYVNNGTEVAVGDGPYYLLEGDTLPENGKLTVLCDTALCKMTPVSSVGELVSGGDYSVSSLEEWLYLEEHIEYFRDRDVTVHLLCDIDLEGAAFDGFADPFFSFDGHGHILSHWGTAEEPIAATGLFSASTELAGGMNFIKNLRMEDCHLTVTGSSAMIYSPTHGNAGYSGLPALLTMENLHIAKCTLVTANEACSFILARYSPATGNFTVNMTNCSVTDSTMDANNKDHKGLLVGKVRSNDKNGKGVFNLTDCYLAGNTILHTDGTNAGFIFGTAEGGYVTANLKNIGVVNNTMTNTDGALIGFSNHNAAVHGEKLFFAANKVAATATYLLTSDQTAISCTGSDLYVDTQLTAGSKYGGLPYEVRAMEDGVFTYGFNELLEKPSVYWGMREKLPIPADNAHRTAKLTVVDENGFTLDTLYLNGRADHTFADVTKAYTLKNPADAELDGRVLTMPTGGAEVIVLATETAHEHEYVAAVAVGEATHKRGCIHCDHETEEETCLFTDIRTADIPALGQALTGAAHCIDDCGNRRAEQSYVMGDITGNGAVSVADAVCILRVAGGITDPKTVFAALGNADGEETLSTADAVLLLQFLVQ